MVKKEVAAKASIFSGAIIGIAAYFILSNVSDVMMASLYIGLFSAVFAFIGMIKK